MLSFDSHFHDSLHDFLRNSFAHTLTPHTFRISHSPLLVGQLDSISNPELTNNHHRHHADLPHQHSPSPLSTPLNCHPLASHLQHKRQMSLDLELLGYASTAILSILFQPSSFAPQTNPIPFQILQSPKPPTVSRQVSVATIHAPHSLRPSPSSPQTTNTTRFPAHPTAPVRPTPAHRRQVPR